jgi:hypothetical protein
MSRTATEAAKILTLLYEEFFGNDIYEKYRIQWERLREICAVRRLDMPYLNEITVVLNSLGFSLACFDDFILVMKESDSSEVRSVPGRLVEKYLPEDIDVEDLGPVVEPEDVELEDE